MPDEARGCRHDWMVLEHFIKKVAAPSAARPADARRRAELHTKAHTIPIFLLISSCQSAALTAVSAPAASSPAARPCGLVSHLASSLKATTLRPEPYHTTPRPEVHLLAVCCSPVYLNAHSRKRRNPRATTSFPRGYSAIPARPAAD